MPILYVVQLIRWFYWRISSQEKLPNVKFIRKIKKISDMQTDELAYVKSTILKHKIQNKGK